jgi:hypothetical protein
LKPTPVRKLSRYYNTSSEAFIPVSLGDVFMPVYYDAIKFTLHCM